MVASICGLRASHYKLALCVLVYACSALCSVYITDCVFLHMHAPCSLCASRIVFLLMLALCCVLCALRIVCSHPLILIFTPFVFQGSTEAQRQARVELMEKLRNQLDDIELCAKQAASAGGVVGGRAEGEESESQACALPPGSEVANPMAEKQRIIIEELRKRFDFQFGDLEGLRWELY